MDATINDRVGGLDQYEERKGGEGEVCSDSFNVSSLNSLLMQDPFLPTVVLVTFAIDA